MRSSVGNSAPMAAISLTELFTTDVAQIDLWELDVDDPMAGAVNCRWPQEQYICPSGRLMETSTWKMHSEAKSPALSAPTCLPTNWSSKRSTTTSVP